MSNYGRMKVFSTGAGQLLTEKICDRLSIDQGKARIGRFTDGEPDVQILENVRGDDVYIIAPTQPPAENFDEAILLAEAARLSSAAQVTYVIPYMGWARSDRKDGPRKPVGIQLAFKKLENAQPNRFIILDIHAEQSLSCIQHAVYDHLFGSAIALPELKRITYDCDFVVASPDKGGAARAEKYARLLGQNDFVIFSKSRPQAGQVDPASIKIIGEVSGKMVILVDDIIDSGGTIVADAEAAIAAGATHVYAFATHGLLSKDALERIRNSPINAVYITDTICHPPEKLAQFGESRVQVLSADALLARAIRRTHDGESLSALIP